MDRDLLKFTWERQRYEYTMQHGDGLPDCFHRSHMTTKYMVPLGCLREECFNFLCNMYDEFYDSRNQVIHLSDEAVRSLREFEAMVGGDLD